MLQKRKQQIVRAHKKAAVAAVAALCGATHGVERLNGFRFSASEQQWSESIGLAPRPDWFLAVWSDGSKPSWVHIDQLGGYSDDMVRECMLKHKQLIAQQAATSPAQRGKREKPEPAHKAQAGAQPASAAAAAAVEPAAPPAAAEELRAAQESEPAPAVIADREPAQEPAAASAEQQQPRPAISAAAEESGTLAVSRASKRQRSDFEAASMITAAAAARSLSRQTTVVLLRQAEESSNAPRAFSAFSFDRGGGQAVAEDRAHSAAAAM